MTKRLAATSLDQEPYRRPAVASDIDDFLADARALAEKYRVDVRDVIEAAKALEMERANSYKRERRRLRHEADQG